MVLILIKSSNRWHWALYNCRMSGHTFYRYYCPTGKNFSDTFENRGSEAGKSLLALSLQCAGYTPEGDTSSIVTCPLRYTPNNFLNSSSTPHWAIKIEPCGTSPGSPLWETTFRKVLFEVLLRRDCVRTYFDTCPSLARSICYVEHTLEWTFWTRVFLSIQTSFAWMVTK